MKAKEFKFGDATITAIEKVEDGKNWVYFYMNRNSSDLYFCGAQSGMTIGDVDEYCIFGVADGNYDDVCEKESVMEAHAEGVMKAVVKTIDNLKK